MSSLLRILMLVAAELVACDDDGGEGEGEPDGDGDVDADSDSDTDVDTDSDSDADSDGDSDSDSDGDADRPWDVERLVEEFAEAFCSAAEGCCEDGWSDEERDRCRTLIINGVGDDVPPGASVDPAIAPDCIASIPQLLANCPGPGMPYVGYVVGWLDGFFRDFNAGRFPSCAGVFVVDLGEGDECRDLCGPGLYCQDAEGKDGSADLCVQRAPEGAPCPESQDDAFFLSCEPGLICLGVCLQPDLDVPEGQPCTPEDWDNFVTEGRPPPDFPWQRRCIDGFFCGIGEGAESGRCRPRHEEGEPCSSDCWGCANGGCAEDMACDGERCVRLGADGEACPCAPSHYCDEDDTCQPAPGDGEPCATDDFGDPTCAEGLYCEGDVCITLPNYCDVQMKPEE